MGTVRDYFYTLGYVWIVKNSVRMEELKIVSEDSEKIVIFQLVRR
jgi:hypothetical protein